MGQLNVKRVDTLTCPLCQAELDGADLNPLKPINCPHCQGKINVPAAFGSYLLQSMVRSDGFSAAFRAFDTVLERQVALRVIIDTEDTARLTEVTEHVRSIAAISHEHLAALYNVGQVDGHMYVEAELLTGGTLRDMMTSAGALDPVEALGVIYDVASGLKACHDVQLYHGAIGLDRLWLDQNGSVKIADFIGDRLRRRSGMVSDLQTAAPELIAAARRNEADTCHAASIDIYALGVVLYQLVTGEPPFPETLKACVDAKLEPIPLIKDLPELSDLIGYMTAFHAVERPANMAQLLELIDGLLLEDEPGTSELEELATEVGTVHDTALDTGIDSASRTPSSTQVSRQMSTISVAARAADETHQAAMSTVMQPKGDISAITEKVWTIDRDQSQSFEQYRGYPEPEALADPLGSASHSESARDSAHGDPKLIKKGIPASWVAAALILLIPVALFLVLRGNQSNLATSVKPTAAHSPERKKSAMPSAPSGMSVQVDAQSRQISDASSLASKAANIEKAPSLSQAPEKISDQNKEVLIPENEPIACWYMARAGDASKNKLATELVGPSVFKKLHGNWHLLAVDGKGAMKAAAPPQLKMNDSFSAILYFTPVKVRSPVWLIDWGEREKDSLGFGIQLTPDGYARIGFSGKGRYINVNLKSYWDQPIHLAVTVDHQLKRMTVFLNGRNVASSAVDSFKPFEVAGEIRMGGDAKAGYSGGIDEVRLYATALPIELAKKYTRLPASSNQSKAGHQQVYRWLPATKAVRKEVALKVDSPHVLGGGYLAFNQKELASAEWTIDVPVTGHYELTVRYASGSDASASEKLQLYRDGAFVKTINFSADGNLPETWMTQTETLPIHAGKRKLSLTAIPEHPNPKIDILTLWLSEPFTPKSDATKAKTVNETKVKKAAQPDAKPKPNFQFDKAMEVIAASGAKVQLNSTFTPKVASPSRKAEIYTCTLATNETRVTGVRLVVLAHKSMRSWGPGIGPRGAFAISDMTIEAASKAKPDQFVTIKAGEVNDDESIPGFRPESLLDGNPLTRWGVKDRPGFKRVVTIPFEKPFKSKDGIVLKVTIKTVANLNFKTFRLYYTCSTDKHVLNTAPHEAPPKSVRHDINFGYDKSLKPKGKQWWKPGKPYKGGSYGYIGGSSHKTDGNVSDMINKGVFVGRSCQAGMTAVQISVPRNNRYRVTAYFQENWTSKPMQRVFDVSIEGRLALKELDLARSVGKGKMLKKTLDVEVKDGILDITFKKRIGSPIINAVSVVNIGELEWAVEDYYLIKK